jgi:hypothetical protein
LNEANATTLNIAGNGIYTLRGEWTQAQIDNYVEDTLNEILTHPKLKNRITEIRTGGQTGVDEAGAKAAIKLGKIFGIKTTILAPKGWKFRDESGADISDEKLFKERFGIRHDHRQVTKIKLFSLEYRRMLTD